MPKQDNFALNLDGNENEDESNHYTSDAVFGLPIEDTRAVNNAKVQELETRIAEYQELETVISEGGAIVLGRCKISKVGLEIPEDLSVNEWDNIGESLFRLEGSLQWMVGDWLGFGENRHYGYYDKIAEQLHRDASTLYNWKWVASQFPTISRRREDLEFGHHQAVASMKSESERMEWLAKAAYGDEGNRWGVKRFREEIRKSKVSGDSSPSPTVDYAKLRSIAKENKQAVFVLERLSTGDVTNEQWRKIAKILEG